LIFDGFGQTFSLCSGRSVVWVTAGSAGLAPAWQLSRAAEVVDILHNIQHRLVSLKLRELYQYFEPTTFQSRETVNCREANSWTNSIQSRFSFQVKTWRRVFGLEHLNPDEAT